MSDDKQKQIDEIKAKMTEHDSMRTWEKWSWGFMSLGLLVILSLSMYQCSLKQQIDTKVQSLIEELNKDNVPVVVITPTPAPKVEPTQAPVVEPTQAPQPTVEPTAEPIVEPTTPPIPTAEVMKDNQGCYEVIDAKKVGNEVTGSFVIKCKVDAKSYFSWKFRAGETTYSSQIIMADKEIGKPFEFSFTPCSKIKGETKITYAELYMKKFVGEEIKWPLSKHPNLTGIYTCGK